MTCIIKLKNTMPTWRFKIILKKLEGYTGLNEAWYPALNNIYGIQGNSYDGYISSISNESGSLILECYLVEGPEENHRLSDLKNKIKDWNSHRESSVKIAIMKHSNKLGYMYPDIELIPLR